jgi:hypothetical protein
MREADGKLNEILSSQFGAVSREQGRSVKLNAHAMQRRVDSGALRWATDRVAVSTSAPDSFEQRTTVGLLDGGEGTALSSESALAYFGVSGFAAEPIHLSRTRTSNRDSLPNVVWHHPRYLPEHHVMRVNGLVVTTPARALADVANLGLHPKRLERAFDSAWAARLVNRPLLAQMATEWCERGRRGSAFMHEYLDSRPVDFVPAASNVARRFIQLVVDAGMPEPRSEVNVGDAVAWLGRVDCVDPEYPLVAEIDSERFHAAPIDAAGDEQREAGITRGGFTVVRFSEFRVWHRGSEVVDEWRAKRQEMRRAG